MNVKSRYEAVADLEEKKRELILERDSLDEIVLEKKREIKMTKRVLEDKEEELGEFEASIPQRKETINALIASTDQSLDRFAKVGK